MRTWTWTLCCGAAILAGICGVGLFSASPTGEKRSELAPEPPQASDSQSQQQPALAPEPPQAAGQPRVLIFSKTAGYRHDRRPRDPLRPA